MFTDYDSEFLSVHLNTDLGSFQSEPFSCQHFPQEVQFVYTVVARIQNRIHYHMSTTMFGCNDFEV